MPEMSRLRTSGRTAAVFLGAAVLCAAATSSAHQTKPASDAKASALMTKPLTGIEGKEGTMITVEYPPGGASPAHRHDAHVFVYVLEGSIVMQVKGGAPVTLTPGQTFYEGLDDVHIVHPHIHHSQADPGAELRLHADRQSPAGWPHAQHNQASNGPGR